MLLHGGPYLAGLVGLLPLLFISRRGTAESISDSLSRSSRRAPTGRAHTFGPGLWPLAAPSLARIISAALHGSGWDYALISLTGPIAYLYWSREPHRIAPSLRRFGLVLVGVQAVMLLVGYVISSNLMAHCLMLCLAACLAPGSHDERIPRPLVTAVISLALVSTLSKGAAMGAVAMLAWYWSVAWVALPVAPLAAWGLWQFRPWDSLGWRLRCWAEAARKVYRSPWIGHGPGAMAWDHPMAAHAHNLSLNTLLWDGALGLALIVAGSTVAARARKTFPRWAIAGLIAYLVHTLVDDFTGSALCLALLAALLATAASPSSPMLPEPSIKKAPPCHGGAD